jgi:OmcA/MtrC family decaheme c-type cytochrome
VHAIHATAKRTVPYNWHAVSATENFSEVTYPGILSDCETCHVTGTYDLSAIGTSSSPSALGKAIGAFDGIEKRLFRTVGTGTYSSSISNSPYITLGVNYGTGFSFNTATAVTTEAASTTLVTSPTVAACSACHDSGDAISHYKINGGAFYQPRSTAITGSNETCLVCHGAGRTADIKVMHSKNR